MSKSVVRGVKNITRGYSSVQVKVRNATSNDAWGPSGTDMSEIAQLTFNSGDFQDIMDMLDKRLNDKGKNWRHVLKSLKVLDYCLHEGSEHVVTWARNNIYIIKTLREFQYTDEESRDVGLNVRQSAKELTSLILDEERLRAERKDRKNWKSRVTGLDEYGPSGGNFPAAGPSSPARPSRTREPRLQRSDENDLEYQLALEASKNEMEEERKRRESKARFTDTEDDDLRKAIQLSQEEEELRKRELEEKNSQSLFDDTPAPAQVAPQATGWNQGYQQQGAVDWYGNLLDQQQPQNTGYLNNAYAAQQQQPQQTGFQNGYGAFDPYAETQQTGYNQGFMQPQQTAFNMNNPYSQQNPNFGEQQQPQPLQNQPTLQPGSHNPWGTTSPTGPPAPAISAFDSLKPQPTGSNNPFASSANRQSAAQQSPARAPTLGALQEQRTAVQHPQNPQHAHLNALLASGEGQDTFGNVGATRIPAQHTAPGVFVNSAGHGLNRLNAQQTGAPSNNPFLSTQFTGMPSVQQPAMQQPMQQQQQQQYQQQSFMQPAQTGFGAGYANSPSSNNNPFGAARPQGYGAQQQSGSLIDL